MRRGNFTSIIVCLGSLAEDLWLALWGVVYVSALWWSVGALLLPAVDPLVNSSESSERIKELTEKKLLIQQLLARTDNEHEVEAHAVKFKHDSEIDNVLELIQRGAQSSRVKVASLTNQAPHLARGAGQADSPYKFSVNGTFAALTKFVETVSHTTSGLVVAELAIHNRLWPQFSGLLEAELTLRVIMHPN